MNIIIWLSIGFLSWLFLYWIDDHETDKDIFIKIKEIILNTLFGPVTIFFVILGLILSKEFRKATIKKFKK